MHAHRAYDNIDQLLHTKVRFTHESYRICQDLHCKSLLLR